MKSLANSALDRPHGSDWPPDAAQSSGLSPNPEDFPLTRVRWSILFLHVMAPGLRRIDAAQIHGGD
jgi:hypothetical protein